MTLISYPSVLTYIELGPTLYTVNASNFSTDGRSNYVFYMRTTLGATLISGHEINHGIRSSVLSGVTTLFSYCQNLKILLWLLYDSLNE